jgi:hypothetical protein
MDLDRYSAQIGESFSARAAVARSVDEMEWEHEQLRRRGLSALQIFKNGKAVWEDRPMYDSELAEARREGIDERFQATNEADAGLYQKIDADLCARWRNLGYAAPTLGHDMKRLFTELARDVAERAEDAREGLLVELLNHN